MDENLIEKSVNKKFSWKSLMNNTNTFFNFISNLFTILTFILLIIIGIIMYNLIKSEFIKIYNKIDTIISFIEDIPQNISKIVTGGIPSIHI